MTDYIDTIIDILEKSINKHGDKPLTLLHLVNILEMAKRNIELENRIADAKHGYENWMWG
jgi:hypothetical protein